MNTPRMKARCGLFIALLGLTFSASGAPPFPPENLRAAWVDNRAAVLTWELSAGAESYKVYRYDTNSAGWVFTDYQTSFPAFREIPQQEPPLEYAVTAVNSEGESS